MCFLAGRRGSARQHHINRSRTPDYLNLAVTDLLLVRSTRTKVANMATDKKRKHVHEPNNVNLLQQSRKRIMPPLKNNNRQLTVRRDRPFRLLDLPRELRDLVYKKVLEIYPVAHLSRFTSDRNLLTDCRLLSVSKQVQAEFRSVLNLHAPVIHTGVNSFDFGHVIHFLNCISDAELQKLQADTVSGLRQFSIHMGFRGHQEIWSPLQRWLNRKNNPEKRGAGIEYHYTCDHPIHWALSFDIDPTPGTKSWEEWEKIEEAGHGQLRIKHKPWYYRQMV